MSAKADKGDRKREIEQSPMKKKFRDSAISREDLDDAIANRIELAFKEQKSNFNSVVNSAVRDAMDSVLIPALRELREDIQATNKSVKEPEHVSGAWSERGAERAKYSRSAERVFIQRPEHRSVSLLFRSDTAHTTSLGHAQIHPEFTCAFNN